ALIVLPALTLNYLGQGAFTLTHLDHVNQEFAMRAGVGGESLAPYSTFFDMVPLGIRLPMVILATAATIIASQAAISGAYSLTQQAIQLGLLPRLEIRRTS